MENNPAPKEKVCANCKHVLWMVALGQGVQCSHPNNKENGKNMPIHNRRHSCEFFEFKEKESENK